MNSVNPLTEWSKLIKPTLSCIPSSTPWGEEPSTQLMVRRAWISPPDEGLNSIRSTATPPSAPGGKPGPARPKDLKLTSSSTFHFPLASTTPAEFGFSEAQLGCLSLYLFRDVPLSQTLSIVFPIYVSSYRSPNLIRLVLQ